MQLGSMLKAKKTMGPPIADPAMQGAPNLSALKQGTLSQQTPLNDPNQTFKKRLKQNSPISLSWLNSAMRTGTQAKVF